MSLCVTHWSQPNTDGLGQYTSTVTTLSFLPLCFILSNLIKGLSGLQPDWIVSAGLDLERSRPMTSLWHHFLTISSCCCATSTSLMLFISVQCTLCPTHGHLKAHSLYDTPYALWVKGMDYCRRIGRSDTNMYIQVVVLYKPRPQLETSSSLVLLGVYL